jgi:Fe-S cluster biogenesis protein NfuA/nitrite reductase/ring-hydroxylating ferredoxin subunit
MATTATLNNTELERLADAVDKALLVVNAQAPDAQKHALDLKKAIEDFHKLGLTKIIQKLKEDPRGKELLFELVDDPTVYALFQMHGLVREDLGVQAARVLDSVRPYMQSHGGDVELVEVREDTVVVRLSGSCNGCSMSAVTLRNTVEEAIHEHLPQIKNVEVAPNEPDQVDHGHSHAGGANAGFVSLDAIAGTPKVDHGWMLGPIASTVQEAVPFRLDADGASFVIVRFHGRLQAFRNECAHLGMPIDGASVDPETGVLVCPWHGSRFDCTSGECLTVPEAQLEALPLRLESGRVLVRTAA